MSIKIDLVGKQFGRWTVLSLSTKESTVLHWNCICSCGKEKVVSGGALKGGKSVSCGCYQKEIAASKYIHGESGKNKTVEYNTWKKIKDRCLNPECEQYKYYGGRGITICDTWVNSYENFLEDMGRRPLNKNSIERLNTSLGYFKDNCIWADNFEQANNKRSNVLLLHKETGTFHTSIAQAERDYGYREGTVKAQLLRGSKTNFLVV